MFLSAQRPLHGYFRYLWYNERSSGMWMWRRTTLYWWQMCRGTVRSKYPLQTSKMVDTSLKTSFHNQQQIIIARFRLYKQLKHCPQRQLSREIQQQDQMVMIIIRVFSATKRVLLANDFLCQCLFFTYRYNWAGKENYDWAWNNRGQDNHRGRRYFS